MLDFNFYLGIFGAIVLVVGASTPRARLFRTGGRGGAAGSRFGFVLEHFRAIHDAGDSSNGFHLWSDTFDHTLGNILDFQTKTAESVALALEGQLVGANTI